MEAESVVQTESRPEGLRLTVAFAAVLAGGTLSGMAAISYSMIETSGVTFPRVWLLLILAPLLEEHLKLGATLLGRHFGFRRIRRFGAWLGFGFAALEAILFSVALVNAGHSAALPMVLSLRLLLTFPLHIGTGYLHGRAAESPRGGLAAIYRNGSGAAILLHVVYNAGLLGIQTL